jgi:hypothetical protein
MRLATVSTIILNVLCVHLCWADSGVPEAAAPIVQAKVGTCHFKYKDFYKGFLEDHHSSYYGKHPFYTSGTMMLNFSCRPFEESDKGQPAASYAYMDIDNDVNNGAMLDPKTGKWVIHPIEVGPADEEFIQNSVQAKLLAKSRFGGQLDAVNSTGYYRVEKPTYGDEARREYSFSACLMHPPAVLCALATNAGALRQPKKSLVPYLIKLLQTVEFVD